MILKAIAVGALQSNCYFYGDEESGQVCVIDPGAECEKILSAVQAGGWRVCAIVLTHGHFDHIGACHQLQEETGAPVYIGLKDAAMLTDPQLNLVGALGGAFCPIEHARMLKEGDVIAVGRESLAVMETPGHTAGGICLLDAGNGILFSGDTLFFESIGRTDLPTGDHGQLTASLQQKLSALPDGTSVYPGHGMKTTIGHEKAHNPFLLYGYNV